MELKVKIRRRCKCGCGGITNYGKKYIRGHNSIKYSEGSKRKMSISAMGNVNARGRRSEATKRNMSLGKMGNTNGKGRRSKETIDKISLSLIGNKRGKGNKGIVRTKEYKLKISEIKKEHWQDPEYQRKQFEAQNLKPNKPETILLNLLNKLYPNEYKYVGDFQFFLGGKNPDFMNINGQKKLIELYGDYWHRNADPQNRIDHFKQYGFNTLVIWENELEKSRLQLRRRLKEFHII